MADDSRTLAGGFLGALGDFFGTLIGRVFVGAVMVLGGATVGTKIGAPDRFTGTEGRAHDSRIKALESYVDDNKFWHERIENRLEVMRETCTKHRLEPAHETAGALIDQLRREISELRLRVNDISHKHVKEWGE